MAELNVDLEALENEIGSLSEEEIREQLVSLRTKQRVQQKKYHNTEAAVRYRKARAEKFKAMVARARALGIYDSIKASADAKADELLAGEAADADTADNE